MDISANGHLKNHPPSLGVICELTSHCCESAQGAAVQDWGESEQNETLVQIVCSGNSAFGCRAAPGFHSPGPGPAPCVTSHCHGEWGPAATKFSRNGIDLSFDLLASVACHCVTPAAMVDTGAGVPSPGCNFYGFTALFFRCRWGFERKTPVKFLKIAKEKV